MPTVGATYEHVATHRVWVVVKAAPLTIMLAFPDKQEHRRHAQRRPSRVTLGRDYRPMGVVL